MNYLRRIWIFFILSILLCQTNSYAKTPELLKHTEGDLSSSFSDWPVFILVGGVLTTSFLLPLDDHVDHYFSDHRFSRNFDNATNWIANPYVLSTASAFVYGTSLLTENEEFQRTSETMVEALIFDSIMVGGLKLAFNRTRPNGSSYSFPSGHTATMFTIASVLESMEGWKFGIPAYGAAAIVGFSRLDGRDHHLTDVVFGAALGSFVGIGTSLFHQKDDTHLLISPILDQTRGIMLTYKY
jgi:membrane-associated phospholipid phosphatase